MASASAARTLVALLVASCLSGLVLANDAGTGGDAGDSTSTAAWLPAANATYYGNLTASSDNNDYYGVNMSTDTGIAVGLTSPSGYDFDLLLYDSNGSTIDSSYSTTSYDSVSSNGTNVGGTTVYINVDRWTGSGQYTLQIWIFTVTPPPAQNDANTGGDAGDTYSTPTALNGTNATYYGYVDKSTDEFDYYSIPVPSYHRINASVSWNTSSATLHLHLYDSTGAYLPGGQGFNTTSPNTVTSGNSSVGGTTVTLMVRAWIGDDDYTLTLWFDNVSSSPVYNQNDSGTGDDASDDYNNPTGIITNIGQNDFTGWASSADDVVDEYSVDVPADYGISVSVSFDTGEANFDVALALMPNPASNIIDLSQTSSSPETVTSNGTYVGGETVLIEIYANTGEGDYNMTIWIFTLDTDGDGFYDEDEITCGSDPDDASSVPQDTDADGICDVMDYDDDGDGYEDANDSFPLDDTEWEDTDNDGIGNNADEDDDGDGWTDTEEYQCGSDPLSFNSQPTDTDTDGICDPMDDDDDGDGYLDSEDAFPLDAEEWLDTDGDLIGDNEDIDDDGDGFSDAIEATCGSDPLDANSLPPDTDQDGSCDAVDGDDDNDGYADVTDAFPLDAGEWVDTDGDGTGDNSDVDDDGDGYPDNSDAFPLDSTEWEDNDGDGLGNNADLDDDNDGWSDTDESDCQSDPFSAFSTPDDFDDDHLCDDPMDDDDDGDGVDDIEDMFPFDATEWADLDLDGIGDNTDEDDDGDSWSDLEEPNCGTDPMDANSFPADFDGDRICDVVDNDDDNDMVLDINDAFQFDPAETKDTDGDGQGNNADPDDDGDDWPDNLEVLCFSSGGQGDSLIATVMPADNDDDGTCDAIDADDDNDMVLDEVDVFPFDGAEWEDRNGDGLGDNGHPLTLVDKMKLNPVLTVVVFALILAVFAGIAAFTMGRRAGQAEETWKDDGYQRYDQQPALREEKSRWADDEAPPPPPARPISPPEPEVVPEPEPEEEEPEPEPEMEQPEAPPPPPDFVKPPPPPPPGFEGLAPPEPEGPVTVDSWEDLPDGGDYVQTEPMQYTGEDCGTWIRQPDDSWELQ